MKKRKRGKIMHSKKHKSQMSIIEFQKTYDTEDKCREELFKMRYPKGFKCSKCECTEYYYLKSRGKYQWKNCKHQSGTVMDRSHLKLTVWLWAIYLFSNDKRGSSACSSHRFSSFHINPPGLYSKGSAMRWKNEKTSICFREL